MNFQITNHRKLLVTLGAGVVALTAVACSSDITPGGLEAGNPPSSPPVNGSGVDGFALGVPAGIDDILLPTGNTGEASVEYAGDNSTTSGAVTNGVGAAVIAPGTPPAPGYDCETGSSHPVTLFIEGEPVTPDPVTGNVVHDLPVTIAPNSLGAPAPGFADAGIPEMIVVTSEDNTAGIDLCNEGCDSHDITVPIEPISLGMPAPGFADAGIPETIVVTSEVNTAGIELYNEGADSHDMPVPILYGTPVLITADPPEPVKAPSTRPIAEQAGGSVEDTPPPIAVPVAAECGSGVSEPDVSVEPISDTDRALLQDIIAGADEELPDGVKIVAAPIESAGISVAESFPLQYMLWVVSGLPNGATTFGNYAVKRDGNVVAVSVTNYVLTDVLAAQFYGIHQSNIGLGSDFTSGEVYSVVINGRPTTEFTAQ